ncbi:NAC domain-containing protein 83-like [Salvia miltiorrhiza]|uniref:NAC domain-containing protein 83-like n=1 Tax=Salvia miltiorrhiza TaxID=226208 RepID=UPI0025ACC97D|nr:NAC domain-containing protein 83-like [Salvia miltiorrhiza]
MNIVREGGSKLPPGFRFEPTDEEIVFQYLSRKTFSHPLPALVIPELDVFTYDPCHLPGDGGQDMYFFCNKEGRKMGRASECGFWKASGSPKRIICSKKMPIIGIRKSFVFHRRTKRRTQWIMHEYYLALSQNTHQDLVRIGNWTLCRIFLKKLRVNARKVDDVRSRDFLSDSYSSSASSTDSGIFTEVSSS